MSEEIRPALWPSEWAAWQAGDTYPIDVPAKDGRPPCLARSADGQGLVVNGTFTARTLPGLMALANAALADGDPRKITRADVHACADASMFDGPHPAFARLALKLAALFPTEGT